MTFTWTIVARVVLLAIAWRFLGSYMAAVYGGRVRWLSLVERPIYRVCGVDRAMSSLGQAGRDPRGVSGRGEQRGSAGAGQRAPRSTPPSGSVGAWPSAIPKARRSAARCGAGRIRQTEVTTE
jgi:hypothetical protein